MSNLLIRPALEGDFENCLTLNPGYHTSQVWQMHASNLEQGHSVRFQATRLPRPYRVQPAHDPDQRLRLWQAADYFVVGEERGAVVACMSLAVDPVEPLAWLVGLVVEPEQRRLGYGSELLATASRWARHRRLQRLMVTVQPKNFPAIRFLLKHGGKFSGYNEYYHASGDIALYFSLRL